MAFQYAGGTNVNTTFAADTRTLIADNIRTHLLTAGWTSISGASGDWILQSALTPQNLQCRVRLYDSGGGNCGRVQFRNVGATLLGIDLFLLASAGYVYRIIANKYQFFVLRAGSTAAREFVCGGVPYLEPFLDTVITECIWSHGNAHTDADTTTRRSFRTQCNARGGGARWQVVNGNAWSASDLPSGNKGDQRLLVYFRTQALATQGAEVGRLWSTLEAYKVPARINWGLTSILDEAKCRGQLWDGAVIMKDYPADTVDAFDAHNWFCITASGTGGQAFASLFVVIP